MKRLAPKPRNEWASMFMQRGRVVGALAPLLVGYAGLGLAGIVLAGCEPELGKCDDPNGARNPVLAPSGVMYEGQAILYASCAGGVCHASTATGDLRKGAPAGLNYDLAPVLTTASSDDGGVPAISGDSDGGVSAIAVEPDALAGLRRRQ